MKAKKGELDDTVFTSLREGNVTDISGKKIVADPTISYKDASNSDNVITASVKMNGAETDAVKVKKDAFAQSTSNAKDETTEKTATLQITITFGWGEYFKDVDANVNPYIYYNKKEYKDIHEEANKVLNALHGLDGVNYVVTIKGTTAVPKNS